MISFRQIIRELMQEKTRLFLTILAIAWATFSIAIMLSVGEGLRQTFGRAAFGMGKNVVFAMPGQTSTPYRGNAANLPVQFDDTDFQNLSAISSPKKNMSREYHFSATIAWQQNSYSATVYAVDANYAAIRNISMQKGGRFIDKFDLQNARRVVVIGNDLETTLFPNGQDPLQKIILIANQPFIVIGVIQNKFSLAGPPISFSAWIPSSTYIALANPQTMNRFDFAPQNSNDIPTVENEFIKNIANQNNLNPNDSGLLQFRDFQDVQQNTDSLFLGMEIFLGVIGTMTLIVAGVGIANVMLIAITHATKEIGIRMAIGAKPHQILMHYVFEGLLTTIVGGIFGLIFTIMTIHFIKKIPVHGAFFQLIGKPKPVLSLNIIFIVIIILGAIGFLAAYFPARRAALIDPAVALREEG